MTDREKMFSRRAWLTKLMLLTAAAGMVPKLVSAAEDKASKSAVHYQQYPKEMQMCGMCTYFEGGGMMGRGMMGNGMMGHGMMGHGMMAGDCQVVEGSVSMMGWCDLYSPRGA